MIGNERVVAIIPARGGSKSVPQKNIRTLGGKPLLVWSIEVARRVSTIDRVIVSTEDPAISNAAKSSGAEVYSRPHFLATDTALVLDAVKNLLTRLHDEGEDASIGVLLEPTCPFRSPEDVLQCLTYLVDQGLDSVATFSEAQLNPNRAWRIRDGRPEPFIPGVDPWQPRQLLPPAYGLNGGVYVFKISGIHASTASFLFGASGAILMPRDRSSDIDTETDFELAEAILARRRQQ